MITNIIKQRKWSGFQSTLRQKVLLKTQGYSKHHCSHASPILRPPHVHCYPHFLKRLCPNSSLMTSWICSKKIRNHLRSISEHHSSPNPSAGAMLPSQVKKQSCKKVRDCKYLSEAKNVSELFVLSEIKNSNLKSLFAQEAQVVDVFAPGPEVQTEKWFTSLNAFNNLRFRAFLCEFSKWVPLRYFLLFFACGFCGWNRPGICYEAKSGKIKSILRLVRQMRRFTRPNVLSNVYIQHSVHHFAFFLYFVMRHTVTVYFDACNVH